MKVEHRLDGVSKSKVPIKIIDGEILEQIKKKDLSHAHCYNCNKYGHYAKECRNSKKRKLETSTIDEESQHEESQALTVHGNKGKGGRSSPTSDQKKKKDLSHICCYTCNKLGYYDRDCSDSKKRKHEASIVDVEEDISKKKPKNEDYMELFF